MPIEWYCRNCEYRFSRQPEEIKGVKICPICGKSQFLKYVDKHEF